MQKIISVLIFAVFLSSAAAAEEDDAVWFELYEQIDYSDLRSRVDAGEVESARIFNDGTWVTIKTKDGEFFDTRVTSQTPVADHLYEAGIPVKFELGDQGDESAEVDKEKQWEEILLNLLPLLIFFAFVGLVAWFMNRQGSNYYSRAEAINKEALDRQQKQFDAFLEGLSSVLKNNNSNV